jgi:hypothetical protein
MALPWTIVDSTTRNNLTLTTETLQWNNGVMMRVTVTGPGNGLAIALSYCPIDGGGQTMHSKGG